MAIFNQFIVSLDRKPDTWEDRLTLFVEFLINEGRKSTTIRSYISAVKAVLQDIDIELNENRFLLSSLTRACKLINDNVRTRLPIYKALLAVILKETNTLFGDQPYLRVLYRALFTTAYFGLFCVGELTAGEHPVLAADIHIGVNKNKMLFILRTSKTHWKDCEPQKVKITSVPKTKLLKKPGTIANNLYPFLILKEYLALHGPATDITEQFFIFSDGSKVKPSHMHTTLRTILKSAGFDPTCYCTQSFRIGRAGDLLQIGLSVETIKKLGRWKSNAVFRYLR